MKQSRVIHETLLNLLLALGDILGVILCFTAAFLVRFLVAFPTPLLHPLEMYRQVWAFILLWPFMFLISDLYPGYWLTAARRLEKIIQASTIAALALMAFTFLTRTGMQFSRLILLWTWLFSLGVLPLLRSLMRTVLGKLGFHGPGVVLLGAGKTAELILEQLETIAIPPVKPAAIFDDDPAKQGAVLRGIPVRGPISRAAEWARHNQIRQLLIAMPGLPRERMVPLVEELSRTFYRVLIVPDLFGIASHETDSREIGDMLALDLRSNLLRRRSRLVKRLLDLSMAVVAGVFAVPLLLLCGALIVIESGFPVFYRQQRLGLHGQPFRMVKFRTMVSNADQVLEEELMRNTALQLEWAQNQKLREDPRLTRVGKLLRRLSLDELPQLWNVLRGEMSVIGPRPIISEEISRYGDRISLYYQVRPGLTGLWQVSGRSSLSYERRVQLDTYYVRNWSFWLDLVLLFRTAGAVLAGKGAF